DIDRSAQLLGAADGLRERAGLGVWPVRSGIEQRRLTELSDAFLGRQPELQAAWIAGRGLTLEMTSQLACGDTLERAAAPQFEPVVLEPASSSPLTAREQQVAGLIAQGRTSKEIADALVITERTADTHAAHIRDKLALRSRAEIAAW